MNSPEEIRHAKASVQAYIMHLEHEKGQLEKQLIESQADEVTFAKRVLELEQEVKELKEGG